MSRRDLSRFAHAKHEYASVKHFLESPLASGVLTIDYNGSPLDILHQYAASKTTVVIFHTALSPRMLTTPVFSGIGVTEGLPVNTISVSDPSLELSDTLKLAWFAGNSRQPLQRDLPGILNHMFAAQKAEHLIFFGASGGGFAALYYSSFFPGSLAVPVNPQISIKDYDDDCAMRYASVCFGATTLDAAHSVLAERVTADLRHRFRGGLSNIIAYVQNAGDTHHVNRHLTPLLNAIPRSELMNVYMENWGKGHVPPPVHATASLLSSLVRSEGGWSTALADYGFVSAPGSDVSRVVSVTSA